MGKPRPFSAASRASRGVGAELHDPPAAGRAVMSVVLALLLAVTMLPAAGLPSAFADKPSAGESEAAEAGLLYRIVDGAATLVGFEEGAALAGAVVVPEAVEDAAVVGVEIAEGQVAEGVTSLTLPQSVERVEVKGLAGALPSLVAIEVAGSEGAYSSAAGMLFRQERGEASSDGSTAFMANAELVWAPPAMVVARIPIECKAVAAGAFVDAAALETVMAFGVMESIAEGAFAGDQVNRVTIVVPITNYASASEGSERVSGSVQLSEGIPTSDKKRPWFDFGFDSDHIVSGAPFGEIDGVVAVSEEGVAEDRSLVTPLENGRSHLDLTPEEAAEKAERRGVDPDHGLSFSYQASMDLSVRWSGDVTATPARLELPAYATIDGVKYQVTTIEPNAFAGAVFLESLVISEGVTTIGESAFENCSNLREVILPSTLRTIDYAAFRGCIVLEDVSIPDSVTWIGGEAFEEGMNLGGITVTTLGASNLASEGNDVDTSITTYSAKNKFAGIGLGSFGGGVRAPGYTTLPSTAFDTVCMADEPQAAETCDSVRSAGKATLSEIKYVQEGYIRFKNSESSWDLQVVRFQNTNGSTVNFKINHLHPSDNRHGWEIASVTSSGTPNRILKGVGAWTSDMASSPLMADHIDSANFVRAYDISKMAHTTVFGSSADGANTVVYLSLATLNSYSLSYGDSLAGASGLRTGNYTVEDAVHNLPAPDFATGHDFYWTGPGYDEPTPANEVDLRVAVAAADAAGTKELKFTGHWEEDDLTLVGGGSASWDGTGGGSKTISYLVGDTVELPRDVKLPGFWLAGWVWANGGTGFNSVTEPTFSLNTSTEGAHGNATLKAVWVPQKYVAEYDVSQAGTKADGGGAWAPTPDPTTLVSSDATTAIDTLEDGGEALYAWDTSYADQRAKRDNIAGAAWVDTKGITADDAHMVDLAGKPSDDGVSSLDLDGFAFKGWTADSTMNAFNPITVPTDTTYTLDGDKMHHAFASVWNKTYTADEADKNKVTLYAIWQNRSIDSGGITLNLNEPTNVNNEGTPIATLDKRGITDQAGRAPTDEGYVAPTEKIYYWQGRGLLSVAEREAIGTNSPTRKTASTIDPGMGLVAPARYGFEFLGWGKLDATDAKNEHPETATLYIGYNEADNTFTLTKEGAALMTGDPNDASLGTDAHGDRAVIADSDWKAVWKIRDIDVSLRIPLHAVKDVDVTGASTGADRNTAGEGGSAVAGATKVDYSKDGSPYAWREVTSADPGNGSTAGWYVAKRTWRYYDLLEYPAFAQQQDRYTYDAWYDTMKPSITDSTDKALQDNPGVRRIVGFNALRPTSQTHVTGAWDGTDDLGLDIDDAFFLTGKAGSMSGTRGITVTTDPETGKASLTKEIWLWTSPIRINVAAPMGIYLCTTNSYGQPVEPYVVGNDRRTQLEAQAEFTVSTSSHDLQLVDVTAEDVIYVERDESGNVINEDKIESLAGLSENGICNQILTPKFPATGDVVDGNGATQPVTYTDETSRMFWVSPVPTATADQTGVIYKSDTVRAKDAASEVVDDPATSDVDEGATKMTSEEALLHPDVKSRRYFGFGHNNDNTITDTLDAAASTKEYKLGDFVLRKNYADAAEGSADRKTDGLARTNVVKNADGAVVSTSYRFYYGLDMRRADFNLTGLQKLIDNSAGALAYNSAFDQPLLKVKFTFAAARNPGISYYAARLDSGVAYDAAAAAADDKIDAATEITAGAPSILQ